MEEGDKKIRKRRCKIERDHGNMGTEWENQKIILCLKGINKKFRICFEYIFIRRIIVNMG
jgi:hypothetical protein